MNESLDIVILGLSITSSWGNGHATTYRGLVRELVARGHRVLFLERDLPWYTEHRDLVRLHFGRIELYSSLSDLKSRFEEEVRKADLVIVGSCVPDGIAVGEWVTERAEGLTAFYDIDTPVTLAKLMNDNASDISRQLIPKYRLYISITGGPTLQRIEREFHSPAARSLYCFVDPALYSPKESKLEWMLGYMGTYSLDRQLTLERLLLAPARQMSAERFVVAGPMYPSEIQWPRNVLRIEHLSPALYREFYNSQKFTLNVMRAEMVQLGYSPNVRLFEAAACGVPIISDWWSGLAEVFRPGSEILVARSTEETVAILQETSEEQRRDIAAHARTRVLAEHTAAHRAAELEAHALDCLVAFC